jgi:YVTN family beta-propeller protein
VARPSSRFDRAVRTTVEEETMKTIERVIRAGAALAIAATGMLSASAPATAASKAVAPRAKVVAKIVIPAGTGGLAVGENAVWSLSWSTWTLMRIDPAKNAITARIKVKPGNPCPQAPDTCGQVAAGNGGVWVSMRTDNVVARIDQKTSKVIATIPVGKEPDGIASSPGAIWVANHGSSSDGPSVSRIDPATNQVVTTIPVGPATACCSDHMIATVGAGSLWVTVPNLASAVRIDQATNAVMATIPLSRDAESGPCGEIAASRDAVWVSGAHCAGVVWRIDPRTNERSGKVSGFSTPIGVGVAFGSLWVADLDDKAIDRVDPQTHRIVGRLRVGQFRLPVLLSIGLGSIWVRDDSGNLLRIAPRH